MKIAGVISNLEAGGAERVMSTILNEWANSHEVHLILLHKGNDHYVLSDKIIVHRLNFSTKYSGLLTPLVLIKQMLILRRLIIQLRCNTHLSFMTKYNLFVICSLLGKKIKLYVSERDSPFDKRFLESVLRRVFYPLASGVIFQTDEAMRQITRPGYKATKVIPNPVNIDVPASDCSSNIILNVSRLHPKKGHDRMFRILAKTQLDAWTALCIGDGPELKKLNELITAYDLNIKLLGKKHDVSKYYQMASIFIFTSYWEGFPNVIAEALAHGIPVVAFDCPTGPSDLIIDGYNGYLIHDDNEVLFREKLEELLQNDLLRKQMGRHAVSSVSHLDKRLVAKEYLNFIT